ncbi:FtsX-like permease family protein [Solirubrobacter phytolaccae]|uniref:FtsX-like permease family protein n=1 Tax=Solirubrobacter phytolaccae TaxID=1404360 RepID=A0A9X3SDJ0_9ACTN|nr:FtsX-like permease family protein [Solirubrobacter phytolaccae]MDA0179747.1 FtsX-like permease family protein [Solirubrobacter phytolaccae]
MRTLAWRGVRNNLGRYVATLVAIITGVGFFTATTFVSDRVISSLEGDVDQQYGNVDAAVVLADSTADLSGDPGKDLKLSARQADRITSVPGVDGSAGLLTAPVAFPPRRGHPSAKAATGRLWIDDAELNPLELTSGRAPKGAGEVAVDRGLAESVDLKVGSRVKVATLAGAFDATVVGVTKFGSADALDQDGTVSVPAAAAFDWLNSGQREYQALYLRGSVDQAQLEREIKPLTPEGYTAQTGEQFLTDQRESTGAIGRYLKQALQAFALLALFVGAFVIYNTFSVIVAQRLRELAVLAAIGATPKQIKRSLRLEGLIIGLLGSALGVVAGLVLTFVLIAVLKAVGVELPGSGIKVGLAPVVQGILLGTVITFLSVNIPARRAAKTEPIEALRISAVDATSFSRRRKITAAVLVVLGAGGLVAGGSWAAIGFGALLLFVGVIVAGPFIALGGARLARPLMKPFGLEGRLAVDNVARNPGRTATTANALLIGVFLVTLVTAAGTSVKDFAVGELKKLQSADFIITSEGGSIDPQLQADFKRIDGVKAITPFRRETVTIDGKVARLSSGDIPAIQKVADLEFARGSAADLQPGTIAVTEADGGPRLGARVRVTDSTGKSQTLRVSALLAPTIDAQQIGALTAEPTFAGLVGRTAPTVAFLDVDSGAQTKTKDAIEARADQRPDITAEEGNVTGQLVSSIFDFVINAVNGLLGMSVIVALIGIINTLSLSILERRRELGLLRVVGMLDGRVQRMVRLESLVIAGLGTFAGIALGLFSAWALIFSIDRIAEADIGFSLPIGQTLLVLVLGLGLGLLAALIPARRSTRLDVLEAIQAT